MYHSISDEIENSVHPYYRINTSQDAFARHMAILSEQGYSVVHLNELKSCFEKNRLTDKFAVITFDDGYHDFYTKAFPVLQKCNFPATVFLPTNFIGNVKDKLKGKCHLTWDQVAYLSDRGICFGSHTVTHPELINLCIDDLEREVRKSKTAIEDKLNKAVDTFSYPFRFPEANTTFINILSCLLQRHGYHCGVTTRIGTTSAKDDKYFMKRIPINSSDDILLLRAKLEGGYDWLYTVQRKYKRIRSG